MKYRGSSKTLRYKDATLSQLRSFYETGRLGSLSAAAQELELSNPTVWEQVHALERYLGKQLVEPYAHGSRLTASGQLFMEIVAPLIDQLNSLKSRFAELCEDQPASLKVGATPRIVAEDLPSSVIEFNHRYPAIRFSLREMLEYELPVALAANKIDLAFAPREDVLQPNAPGSPIDCFDFVPCYQVRPILITPRGHPLAKRRRLTAEMLQRYPNIDSTGVHLPQVIAFRKGDKADRPLQPPLPQIKAIFASTIRCYVKLGFGIGIILANMRGSARDPDLHERDLTRMFGSLTIDAIRCKGSPESAAQRLFLEIVQSTLKPVETFD